VTAASPSGKVSGGVFSGSGGATGDANLATSFTLGGDMMMNLIALSMLCDTNRSFILVYQGVAVNVEGKTIGGGNSDSSCADGGDIGNTGSFTGNVPINKLYVTLMNAVGCKADDGGKVTTFGVMDGTTATAGISNPGEVTKLTAAG
jgi:hypothetical protein